MKGYKVFNPDWKCQGFQYEVGKTYKQAGELEICRNGFHFCEQASDCFNYYSFDSENKVAEIIAHGNIITEYDKSCTNEIEIVRELDWSEVLKMVNTGKDNTGNSNSGDRNSGNRNSGNSNSGYWNSGNSNSGYWNSGNSNSGYSNSGDRNSGYSNSGDRNSGDWNITNNSSGVFNTKEEEITIFNKPSNITLSEWRQSSAFYLLCQIQTHKWIGFEEMTEIEKGNNPQSKTTGGYLRITPLKEAARTWWNNLKQEDIEEIKAIPNFDSEIFEKITGIKI